MLDPSMTPPLGGGSIATAEPSSRPPSRLRRRVEISWVITIVLFTLGRLVVAAETLRSYGLNIWVFGIIDLVTAVPYAVGIAKVVEGFLDHKPRSTSWWGVIACASFLAPYLYILWVGKDVHFPPIVYVVLGLLIAIFGGNAIRGIMRKIKVARDDNHPTTVDPVGV